MKPEISFVIPCYNEGGNVALIYEAIHRVFDPLQVRVETVFSDDGSSDDTYENLKRIYEEHPEEEVQVIRFSRNFGKEAALLAGLRRAKGALVCFIDADMQQRPEVALQMYRILREQPDVDSVAAFVDDRNEGSLMNFFKRSFYKIMNSLCTTEFKNGASDFRMMRRKMADAILSMTEYHRFTKGILSFVGFKTEYMTYVPEERASGRSKWNFFKLFKYAVDGIVGYTVAPLYIPLFAGAFLILASIIYFITMLVLGILHVVSGLPVVIIGLMTLFTGLILFCMGILGEYLGKTYMQVKNRPVYIEKDVLERNSNGESD